MSGPEPHPRDVLREGETVMASGLKRHEQVSFIGTIHTPFTERGQCPRQGDVESGPDCVIEVIPELEDALQGIERFERIEVLYWLHLARRDLLTQSPKGKAEVRGTFSLRSPLRPNPIGTSSVRLLKREGCRLYVRGLDCLDGTPLIDLKPDRCIYTVQAPAKGSD